MPPEKLFSPLASLTQIFLYPCLVKRPKPQWLSGGRQTYIKGVDSTSYLRLSESRKFNIHPHGKVMFNVHWIVYYGSGMIYRVRAYGDAILCVFTVAGYEMVGAGSNRE